MYDADGNGGVESSKSALELIEVKLAVTVLVEGVELAGGVSAHEIKRGVLIEGSGSDFVATLPDSVDGDEFALGAHVEGFVHRLVELSTPRFENAVSIGSDLRSVGPEVGMGDDEVGGDAGAGGSRSEKSGGEFHLVKVSLFIL